MNALTTVFVPILASVLMAQDEDADLVIGKVGQRIVEWVRAAESVGFSGTVLAAKEGEVVAALGVGSADLKGKVPLTPATLFEIASATKQFTAAAVMQLVMQGKLGLDDGIADCLPGVPKDCRAITVRHLLQHTSGIPGTNSMGGGSSLKAVLRHFLRGGPIHPPGTHFEYWNQGYALLSEVIARASREDYVTFCKENLFAPAGMGSTCFTGDKAPRGVTVAVGRSSRGASRSALEHPYGSYGFQYRGMGGVVTSVWDLWRWDRALRGDEVLDANAKAEVFEPGLSDYALGWYVKKRKSGRLVQSHSGSVRGFVCDVRRFPLEDGCLFVLCNRDDLPVTRVAQGLEEILFGDPPTIVKPPRPVDEALAKAIAGRYVDERGAELVIEPDGIVMRARIYWSRPNGPVTRAVLGADDEGGVLLYEWTDETALVLDRPSKKSVRSVSVVGREFRRDR